MPEHSTTQDQFAGGFLEGIVAGMVRILQPVFKWLTVGVGVATTASAIYIGGLAMRNDDVMVAMFEALAIAAGVFATMTALGRFREAAGLALMSCGLAIGGGAILSDPTLVSRYLNTRGVPVVYGGLEIRDVLIWRVAVGGVLALAALVTIWSRNPRHSAWYIVRAALAGLPLVLLGGAMSVPEVRDWARALPGLVRIAGVIVIFFAGLTLVSICGHCLIRSLEVGRLRADGSIDPNPTDAPAVTA